MVKLNLGLKGSGVDVNKRTGFEPYEGDVPTPGTYAAVVKAVAMRVSQNGNPYFNILFEFADQTTAKKQQFKGYPFWEKITPGDSDFQKQRVGQLVFALTGKDPDKVAGANNVDHDDFAAGGKVNKIGGVDPLGAKVKVVVQRDKAFQDQPTLRLSDVFPWNEKEEEWPSGDIEDEETEDEEEPEVEDAEDSEDEEDESDEDEAEDEEEEEDEDEAEEEEDDDEFEARTAELAELDRLALKKILREVNADFKVLKSTTDDALREAILDAEFETEEAPF